MNAISPCSLPRLDLAQPWAEWLRDHERSTRAQRLAAPGWAFDRLYVNVLAQDLVLPRLCAELGLGPAIAVTHRPVWWPFQAERPGPDGVILVLRAAHHGRSATFMLDQSTGEWCINGPPVARQGGDLLELAAWIWGGSDARAAWRITRMAGRASTWAA